MGRKRKQRRQARGSAWHWKQTDCWYYTAPGTKKRVSLFDEEGQRIRGKKSKEATGLALAKGGVTAAGRRLGGEHPPRTQKSRQNHLTAHGRHFT